MAARIIDGKSIAQQVRLEVAHGVVAFREQHQRVPELHVVLAGDDPGSAVYVRGKEKAASEVGMRGHVHRLPVGVTADHLVGLVRELNTDSAVDGILVQLPLPGGLPAQAILDTVDPAKDVERISPPQCGCALVRDAWACPLYALRLHALVARGGHESCRLAGARGGS